MEEKYGGRGSVIEKELKNNVSFFREIKRCKDFPKFIARYNNVLETKYKSLTIADKKFLQSSCFNKNKNEGFINKTLLYNIKDFFLSSAFCNHFNYKLSDLMDDWENVMKGNLFLCKGFTPFHKYAHDRTSLNHLINNFCAFYRYLMPEQNYKTTSFEYKNKEIRILMKKILSNIDQLSTIMKTKPNQEMFALSSILAVKEHKFQEVFFDKVKDIYKYIKNFRKIDRKSKHFSSILAILSISLCFNHSQINFSEGWFNNYFEQCKDFLNFREEIAEDDFRIKASFSHFIFEFMFDFYTGYTELNERISITKLVDIIYKNYYVIFEQDEDFFKNIKDIKTSNFDSNRFNRMFEPARKAVLYKIYPEKFDELFPKGWFKSEEIRNVFKQFLDDNFLVQISREQLVQERFWQKFFGDSCLNYADVMVLNRDKHKDLCLKFIDCVKYASKSVKNLEETFPEEVFVSAEKRLRFFDIYKDIIYNSFAVAEYLKKLKSKCSYSDDRSSNNDSNSNDDSNSSDDNSSNDDSESSSD